MKRILFLCILGLMTAGTDRAFASCEEDRANTIEHHFNYTCHSNEGCVQISPDTQMCNYYSAPVIIEKHPAGGPQGAPVASCYVWTAFYFPDHTTVSEKVEIAVGLPICPNTPPIKPPPGGPSSSGGQASASSKAVWPIKKCLGTCCNAGAISAIGSHKIGGSIVSMEARALGEYVPLVGSNFGLFYYSEFQDGRTVDFKIDIALAGATPRDYLTSFIVETKRGSTILDTQTLTNAANTNYAYYWNGLDGSGNPVDASNFVVTIGEVSPKGTFQIERKYTLGHWNVKRLGLGGWAPSNLVKYDVATKRLYYSNGDVRLVTAKAYGTSQLYIPSEDSSEVYIFDSNGQHIQTKTGLLGTTVLAFSYDSAGKLQSVTEPFGKVTYFNRNLFGVLTSITAPNGQVTNVVIDANGYLASTSNPNSETYAMTYLATQGLLNTFSKPNGETNTFTFDSDGFLTKDQHSGGYFFDLINYITSGYQYNVRAQTGMGRKTEVYTNNYVGGGGKREFQVPSGAWYSTNYSLSGSTGVRIDDGGGSWTKVTSGPSSRFGENAKSVSQVIVQNGGGTSYYNYSDATTLSDPNDPWSEPRFFGHG